MYKNEHDIGECGTNHKDSGANYTNKNISPNARQIPRDYNMQVMLSVSKRYSSLDVSMS